LYLWDYRGLLSLAFLASSIFTAATLKCWLDSGRAQAGVFFLAKSEIASIALQGLVSLGRLRMTAMGQYLLPSSLHAVTRLRRQLVDRWPSKPGK
jgi:hypothetical protein